MRARIGFLGTPEVAVPAFQALVDHADIDVEVVITNPDRRRGRGRSLQPPAIKQAALKADLPIWQPERPAQVQQQLAALDLDACAVVAYGALLPPEMLTSVRHGFINLHFSLLPRWRGAAPVQHAIRAGDTHTGVTTFVLDEGMDTGPILAQQQVAIDPDESAGELLTRLAVLGAPILATSVQSRIEGQRPTPQSKDGVTLAPKITPDDVRISWDEPLASVRNLVRSADPTPGAHTTFRGQRMKVFMIEPAEDADTGSSPPGQIVRVDKTGVVVGLADGQARLVEVQPMGRARMDGAAFVNGYRPEPGEWFGASS